MPSNSLNTYSECWPNMGAGELMRAGVVESFQGDAYPVIFTFASVAIMRSHFFISVIYNNSIPSISISINHPPD